jgi:hypothetical protein
LFETTRAARWPITRHPDGRYCLANNNPLAEDRCEYHVAREHRERYAARRSTAASFAQKL